MVSPSWWTEKSSWRKETTSREASRLQFVELAANQKNVRAGLRGHMEIGARSLSGRHVSTVFWILFGMMEQVYWPSRRSKATEACPKHAAASRLLRMCWSSGTNTASQKMPTKDYILRWLPIQEFYLVPVRLLVQFRLVGCCSRFCCCLAALSLWLWGLSWWGG